MSSRPGLRSIVRTMDPTMRLLLAIGFIEMTAVNFYATVLMPYYRSLGYGSEVAGVLTSILQIVSAFVLLGAGLAADKLGRKRLYLAGQVVRCLVAGSLLVTRNYAGLVMVSVMRGLASVQSPAQSAIVAGYTEKSSRATTLALSQTFAQMAGFIVPLAAGVIADKMGVRVPFTIGLVLAVAATVLGLRVKENGVQTGVAPVDAEDKSDTPAQAASAKFESLSAVARVKRMFAENNRAALWLVLIANAGSGLANGATNILLPFTVMDRFSSAYRTVSGVQAAGSLGTVLVLIIGGRIADVYGRRGIILYSSILFPLALCSVFFVQSIWHVYAMLLVVTMLGNVSSPAIGAIHMEMVSDRDRASFSGLASGLSSAGLALGSVIAGFSYKLSPSWSWAGTIVLFGTHGIMYYLALSRKERQVSPRTPKAPA